MSGGSDIADDSGGARDDPAIEAVRKVIDLYEDAVHTANPESFERAFHPDARLDRPMVPGGPLTSVPLSSYQGGAEKLYDGEVHVRETTQRLSIDVGGHVAVARLDFRVEVGDEPFEGTDFICLAQLGGKWKITYVLWDAHPSPA